MMSGAKPQHPMPVEVRNMLTPVKYSELARPAAEATPSPAAPPTEQSPEGTI